MSMSKKDYEAIAMYLKRARRAVKSGTDADTELLVLTQNLASYFSSSNETFDVSGFYEAARPGG